MRLHSKISAIIFVRKHVSMFAYSHVTHLYSRLLTERELTHLLVKTVQSRTGDHFRVGGWVRRLIVSDKHRLHRDKCQINIVTHIKSQ